MRSLYIERSQARAGEITILVVEAPEEAFHPRRSCPGGWTANRAPLLGKVIAGYEDIIFRRV